MNRIAFTFRTALVSAAVTGASLAAAPDRGEAAAAYQGTFYPGIFPALTSMYAANLQASVDAGHRPWMTDPALVGEAFGRFIHWPARKNSARVIDRSGRLATVRVERRDGPGIELYVEMARLGRRNGGIWSVITCHTTSMRITTPAVGTRVVSPIVVRGVATVFEGAFTVSVLNGAWKEIRRRPMHLRGQLMTNWTARMAYARPAAVAIIEAYALSARDGSLQEVAMVKADER